MSMFVNNDLELISYVFTKQCVERFGNELLGVYFYGSSVSNDFTITSDYDFAVVVRKIDDITHKLVDDILKDICNVAGSDKLEGGFYTIMVDDPWKDSIGIWVDKGMITSKCDMHIEHDSVFAIRTYGKHCYGVVASELLPKITEVELDYFEKKYILEFDENIPRRSSSAQRLYGALLNACRSACYIIDKEYLTKSQAAEKICVIFPELKTVVRKALWLRQEVDEISVTDEDVEVCIKAISLLKNIWRN